MSDRNSVVLLSSGWRSKVQILAVREPSGRRAPSNPRKGKRGGASPVYLEAFGRMHRRRGCQPGNGTPVIERGPLDGQHPKSRVSKSSPIQRWRAQKVQYRLCGIGASLSPTPFLGFVRD